MPEDFRGAIQAEREGENREGRRKRRRIKRRKVKEGEVIEEKNSEALGANAEPL